MTRNDALFTMSHTRSPYKITYYILKTHRIKGSQKFLSDIDNLKNEPSKKT